MLPRASHAGAPPLPEGPWDELTQERRLKFGYLVYWVKLFRLTLDSSTRFQTPSSLYTSRRKILWQPSMGSEDLSPTYADKGFCQGPTPLLSEMWRTSVLLRASSCTIIFRLMMLCERCNVVHKNLCRPRCRWTKYWDSERNIHSDYVWKAASGQDWDEHTGRSVYIKRFVLF